MMSELNTLFMLTGTSNIENACLFLVSVEVFLILIASVLSHLE